MVGLRSRRCQRLLEVPDTPHAVGAKVVKEYGGDMSHFGAPMYTYFKYYSCTTAVLESRPRYSFT